MSPRLKLPDAQVDSHREEMEKYPVQVDVYLNKYTSLQMPSPTRWLIAKLVNTRVGIVTREFTCLYRDK